MFSRRAGAGGDDLHLRQRLSGQFEPVEDGGGDDDGGAVLVVVEDGNAHARLEALLDLEAFRRLDVLEIDAAEGRLQRCHRRDHLLDRRRVDLDIEHVDAGELLEEDRLALHHRLGGQRPDIAEAEHRRSVGDHGDEVGARGVVGGRGGIVADRQAGGGDARRIGHGQVALVAERLGRLDLELSRDRVLVEEQGGLIEIG